MAQASPVSYSHFFFHGGIYIEKEVNTGDLGRIETCVTGEKTLRYLGRRDGLVKVHGIRVHLGDIEQSILTCPMVKQCAVVQPRKGSGSDRLCSFLVKGSSAVSQGSSPSQPIELNKAPSAISPPPIQMLEALPDVLSFIQKAKSAAATRLSTHAIPTVWFVIKELPLTSSRKIDRVKLRSWLEDMNPQTYLQHVESFSSAGSQQPTDPSNDAETQLLQSLWAEVLNRPVSSINPTASFSELGADSVNVMQVVSKARQAGLDLTFSQFYATKTIQRLTQNKGMILNSREGSEDSSYTPFSLLTRHRPLALILEDAAMACGVRVTEIEDIYPCTPYQAGLMALDLKCPGSYICAFSWTLSQDIEIERFRNAWDSLIESEPVLRNRLIWEDSARNFWQVTVRHRSVRWGKMTLRAPCLLVMICAGHSSGGIVKHNDESSSSRSITASLMDGQCD